MHWPNGIKGKGEIRSRAEAMLDHIGTALVRRDFNDKLGFRARMAAA